MFVSHTIILLFPSLCTSPLLCSLLQMANYYIYLLSSSVARHSAAYHTLGQRAYSAICNYPHTHQMLLQQVSQRAGRQQQWAMVQQQLRQQQMAMSALTLVETVAWVKAVVHTAAGRDWLMTEVTETGMVIVPNATATATATATVPWPYFAAQLVPTTNSNHAYYIHVIAGAFVKLLQSPVRLDNASGILAYNQKQKMRKYQQKQQVEVTAQYGSGGTSGAKYAKAAGALIHMPELLLRYAPELAAARDIIDRMAVKGTLAVIVRQTCHKHRLVHSSNSSTGSNSSSGSSMAVLSVDRDEEVLHEQLDELLRQITSGSGDGGEVTYSDIKKEVVRYVRARFDATMRATGVSAAAAEGKYDTIQKELETSLTGLLSESHPVFALFTKRIYKVVYRSLLLTAAGSTAAPAPKADAEAAAGSSSSTASPPAPTVEASAAIINKMLLTYSLQSQSKAATTLLASVNKVFLHSLLVHGVLFSNIVNQAAAEEVEA